jgi:hypothetical protein
MKLQNAVKIQRIEHTAGTILGMSIMALWVVWLK